MRACVCASVCVRVYVYVGVGVGVCVVCACVCVCVVCSVCARARVKFPSHKHDETYAHSHASTRGPRAHSGPVGLRRGLFNNAITGTLPASLSALTALSKLCARHARCRCGASVHLLHVRYVSAMDASVCVCKCVRVCVRVYVYVCMRV
jgi:hypothetical protein